MPRLNEIRCAKCNMKLAEYEISKGQVRIICHKPRCKTMNVVIVRDLENEESEFSEINIAQNRINAL